MGVVCDLSHDAGKDKVDGHDFPIVLARACHEAREGALAAAQPEHHVSGFAARLELSRSINLMPH